MVDWYVVKERFLSVKAWLFSRTMGLWLVFVFFGFFSWGIDWRVFVLLFPVYWQLYFKKELVPEWW